MNHDWNTMANQHQRTSPSDKVTLFVCPQMIKLLCQHPICQIQIHTTLYKISDCCKNWILYNILTVSWTFWWILALNKPLLPVSLATVQLQLFNKTTFPLQFLHTLWFCLIQVLFLHLNVSYYERKLQYIWTSSKCQTISHNLCCQFSQPSNSNPIKANKNVVSYEWQHSHAAANLHHQKHTKHTWTQPKNFYNVQNSIMGVDKNMQQQAKRQCAKST